MSLGFSELMFGDCWAVGHQRPMASVVSGSQLGGLGPDFLCV